MSIEQCRLCSNSNPRGLLLLERSGEILRKINLCLNFQLILDKNLPRHVCKDCYTKILEFNVFQSNCLATEIGRRNDIGMPAPPMSKEDSLSPSCRTALNNQGMKLLRQNIAELSDKVASITQEKELLQSKVDSLLKESDELKSTVISHSKNLPDITKNMMSLLSRMEQQFVLSNSKTVNGSQDDGDDNPEQMDTGYEHLLQWNQGSEEQQQSGPRVTYITNHRQAPDTVNIPGIPQVAYVCDAMVDHITEVEIGGDCNPRSPASPARAISSPTQFEEERVVPIDSEVNALLVQLCEQQERNLQERNSISKPTKSPTRQENTPVRKTNDYELLVSRRSARRPVKKSK